MDKNWIAEIVYLKDKKIIKFLFYGSLYVLKTLVNIHLYKPSNKHFLNLWIKFKYNSFILFLKIYCSPNFVKWFYAFVSLTQIKANIN